MGMMLDIAMEDSRWEGVELPALAERAICATLSHLELPVDDCAIDILACDDARIAGLNGEFREKPTPTNVLSWPAEDLAPQEAGGVPAPPKRDFMGEIALGDIAIAYETCLQEATDAQKSVADHVTHLVIHGTLHLLGYDHVRDPDATMMEALEIEVLGKMGIANPYG